MNNPVDEPMNDPANDPVNEAAIRALADEYWEAYLRANPTYATFLGDHRFDDRIEDISFTGEETVAGRWADLAGRAEAVDPGELSPGGRVTRALLLHDLRDGIEKTRLRITELRYDQMDGLAAELLVAAPQINAPEPADAQALVQRHQQIGRLVDQGLERFRAGVEAGRTPPRAVVARALNQVDGYLASDLDDDPFVTFPGPPDWEGEGAWRDEMRRVVTDVIRPALARYAAGLRSDLEPVARPDDRSGLCHLDDGDDLYRFLVRSHTSLDLDPEDIHAIGLAEVESLREEYAAVGHRLFGETDPAEIFRRLRSDATLRYEDGDGIMLDARRCVDAAAGVMGEWFGRLPQSPCEIQPVPGFLGADAPAAYYFPPAADGSRPGTYFVNTFDPTGRNRFDTASVAFHEAIPGHHLQLAIANELTELPAFQRFSLGHTAFVEGWALYAERLADEMGLYSNDLDLVGLLVNDSWRACRLVVDTGMHALGWTRQQAIDFMVGNMPVGRDEITVEVDRYLAIPGQALAYKVGQREIRRLRADAEERLGDRFAVQGFHDAVLGSSTVSLPVLGELVEAWVAGRAA